MPNPVGRPYKFHRKLTIKRILLFLPFYLMLKPLIKRNYRLREQSALNGDGKHPDVWYWADTLACNNGYFVRG